MNTQRLAMMVTGINLVLLIFILVRLKPAASHGDAAVLRGRALEIVDDQGRIRSQIIITPPTSMPDGKKYAESALFRLIDPNGRPGVKIGTSVDGSGMSLAGDSERREWSGVQILAEGPDAAVKLTTRGGREQVIKP